MSILISNKRFPHIIGDSELLGRGMRDSRKTQDVQPHLTLHFIFLSELQDACDKRQTLDLMIHTPMENERTGCDMDVVQRHTSNLRERPQLKRVATRKQCGQQTYWNIRLGIELTQLCEHISTGHTLIGRKHNLNLMPTRILETRQIPSAAQRPPPNNRLDGVLEIARARAPLDPLQLILKHTGRTIAGRPCLPNVMSRMKREVVLEDEKPVERVDLIVQLLITVTGAWSGWWQAWGGVGLCEPVRLQ